ncbi:MAG: CPBP family glutamic-type intramembrane protease [Opitutales bacterium]
MAPDPLTVILIAGITGYLFHLWRLDLQAYRSGNEHAGSLPGAKNAPMRASVIGGIGALILLAAETGGEIALDISAEQTDITVLFLIPLICAAFYEELIFRGMVVIPDRGRRAAILSALGGSLLFMVIHPYLWEWDLPEEAAFYALWEGTLSLSLTLKACYSSAFILFASLWFYTLRLYRRWNPEGSLIPCVVAHLVGNLGVFIIKLVQGHVTAWY